jgi:hypothetical protein
MQPPPPKSGQALIVVAWIAPFSPAKEQAANAHRHRFLVNLMRRTRRTPPLPKGQGAAELTPDPFPHIRIMGSGGE